MERIISCFFHFLANPGPNPETLGTKLVGARLLHLYSQLVPSSTNDRPSSPTEKPLPSTETREGVPIDPARDQQHFEFILKTTIDEAKLLLFLVSLGSVVLLRKFLKNKQTRTGTGTGIGKTDTVQRGHVESTTGVMCV